jgi:hypothetical protein
MKYDDTADGLDVKVFIDELTISMFKATSYLKLILFSNGSHDPSQQITDKRISCYGTSSMI